MVQRGHDACPVRLLGPVRRPRETDIVQGSKTLCRSAQRIRRNQHEDVINTLFRLWVQAAMVGVPPLVGFRFPTEARTPTDCHSRPETEEPLKVPRVADAVCRSGYPSDAVPVAAPDHAGGAGLGSCRVVSWWVRVVVAAVPVSASLRDVPMHVEQSECIRLLLSRGV